MLRSRSSACSQWPSYKVLSQANADVAKCRAALDAAEVASEIAGAAVTEVGTARTMGSARHVIERIWNPCFLR